MQVGWRCPTCGHGNAPWAPVCSNCRRSATTSDLPQEVAPKSASRGAAPSSGECGGAAVEGDERSGAAPSSGERDECSECDGNGAYTTWPHTTCPTCGGSGQA